MTETKNLDAALLEFQKTIGNPPKNAVNPHFKSKYTTLDALYDHVRGPLANLGIVLTQQIDFLTGLQGATDRCVLHTKLTHAETGEERESIVPIMTEKSGPQAFGSAVTYACRYGLMSLLGLAGDPDDDGNEAQKSNGKPAHVGPAAKPPALDEDVREDLTRFVAMMKTQPAPVRQSAKDFAIEKKMSLGTGVGVTRSNLDKLMALVKAEVERVKSEGGA